MGWVDDKFEEKLGQLAATFTQESQKTRLSFAAAMADTVRGIRIDGALARPVQAGAVNYAAGGRLVGWSLRASGGEAVLDLYDGPAADPARYLASIDLAAGTAQTVAMMPGGIAFTESLYVAQTSGTGTIAGAVWIGAVD